MTSPLPLTPKDNMELKNDLRTKVHSFLENLTDKQWELLKTCTLDSTTRLQMSELLTQIVQTLSNVFLNTAWRNIFTEEDIRASLGNMVSDTFKVALDVKDNGQCKSADNLLKLINEEVADRVNSVMKNYSDTELPPQDLPPKRLHVMVSHAVKMMKNFLARVKKIVSFPFTNRDSTSEQASYDLVLEDFSDDDTWICESADTISSWDLDDDEDKKGLTQNTKEVTPWVLVDVEDTEFTSGVQVKFEDVENLTGDTKAVPLGDLVVFENEADFGESFSTEIFEMELDDMDDPLREDLPDSYFDSLNPDSSNIMFVPVVIEKLFSRIFKEEKYYTVKENKDIFDRLIERTWAEVKVVDFELSPKNFENLDKIIFKDLCKKLGGADQVLLSLKREDEVLMNSIVCGINRAVAPRPRRKWGISNCFSSVCRAISRRRHRRVGVMEDAVEETEEVSSEMMVPISPTLREKKEMFIQIIVEKLFSRIFKKEKYSTIKENKDILERLIEKTSAEVEGIDFELSQKNLKNLDMIIFKDMCKRLGGADQVLLSLKREDEVLMNSVVCVFNRSVAPRPKKKRSIGDRFSSAYQAIFRQGKETRVTKDVVETPEEIPLKVMGPANDPTEMKEEFEGTIDRTEDSEHISFLELEPTLLEKKAQFVVVVIEKLFSRITRKESLDCTMTKPQEILLNLFKRTWVEVEDIDFKLSLKNLKKLDKIIFKDLCKKLGNADQVLMSLRTEDEVLVNTIIYVFKLCGMEQTEKRGISKFFSSMYRAIFRRGHQDDLM